MLHFLFWCNSKCYLIYHATVYLKLKCTKFLLDIRNIIFNTSIHAYFCRLPCSKWPSLLLFTVKGCFTLCIVTFMCVYLLCSILIDLCYYCMYKFGSLVAVFIMDVKSYVLLRACSSVLHLTPIINMLKNRAYFFPLECRIFK